jgi:hypothetical protein
MFKINYSNDNYNQKIIELNDLFYRYLCFIELLCCSRCWSINNDKKDVWHSPGGLLYLLGQNPKINKKDFLFWKNDIDHGFFHGFCVGFWTFMQQLPENSIIDSIVCFQAETPVAKKDLQIEKIFYSCFFHDYLKCIGQPIKHDQNLEKIFPMCVSGTYFHENPSEQYNENFLIVSDRIELNRYEDKSWIDYNKLCTSTFIKNNKIFIDLFYKNIRPCLKEIYFNLQSLWISHTSENMFTKIHKVHKSFYPEYYWQVKEESFKFYKFNKFEQLYASINMDYLPLTNCHKDILYMDSIVGLITKDNLIKNGVSITHSPDCIVGRDHAFMVLKNQVPISEWIFCYIENKNLKYINTKKNKIISFNNVNKFYSICKLLLGKIEGLKVD